MAARLLSEVLLPNDVIRPNFGRRRYANTSIFSVVKPSGINRCGPDGAAGDKGGLSMMACDHFRLQNQTAFPAANGASAWPKIERRRLMKSPQAARPSRAAPQTP